MRNGMNISGFSEIIQEIQQDPLQALFSYSSYATWSSHAGMLGGLNPAQIGVLRAPRRFEAPILPAPAARGAGMLAPAAAAELAIVALSGCFLVSMVSGFSARRTTVDGLAMAVRASLPAQANRPPRVSYTVDAQIDKGREEVLEVMKTVEQHSPNHQTFTHALPLAVELCRDGETVFARTLAGLRPATGSPSPTRDDQLIDLHCAWQYGTQLEATIAEARGLPRRHWPIDQPKQLAGLDRAPNPQEFLLMALAADVLGHLVQSNDGLHEPGWEARLTARAHVDIRGMCDVAPVPVHLQDIRLQLDVGGVPAERIAGLGELLVQSVDVSQVSRIFRQAVQFDIGLGA